MEQSIKSNKYMSARVIAQIGILATISYFLRFIEFPLPIFPVFLKLDISDVPAVFGGLAMGPAAGFIILTIKNIMQIISGGSSTGGIGEIANLVIAGAYVVVVCMAYKKLRSKKGVIIGSIIGTIAMAITGAIIDYYVIFPLYAKIMIPMEQIIQMGQIINPRVTDLYKFMIWLVIPFNIIKGVLTTIVILPLYEKMSKIIHF